MQKLTPADLLTLEQYARERPVIRARMIEHRRHRQLQIGAHCTLNFEDRDTIRYQVQEMLRAEKIFEPGGIAEELESYNPLIPDGANLKATLLIEYPDPDERARQLEVLVGIEDRCWMRVAGHTAVYAIADEDMERSRDNKTSAVHFLRIEFTPALIKALGGGAALAAGIDLPAYNFSIEPLSAELRATLLQDFGQ
jgi:Protein of unknown function (DUF3501)